MPEINRQSIKVAAVRQAPNLMGAINSPSVQRN